LITPRVRIRDNRNSKEGDHEQGQDGEDEEMSLYLTASSGDGILSTKSIEEEEVIESNSSNTAARQTVFTSTSMFVQHSLPNTTSTEAKTARYNYPTDINNSDSDPTQHNHPLWKTSSGNEHSLTSSHDKSSYISSQHTREHEHSVGHRRNNSSLSSMPDSIKDAIHQVVVRPSPMGQFRPGAGDKNNNLLYATGVGEDDNADSSFREPPELVGRQQPRSHHSRELSAEVDMFDVIYNKAREWGMDHFFTCVDKNVPNDNDNTDGDTHVSGSARTVTSATSRSTATLTSRRTSGTSTTGSGGNHTFLTTTLSQGGDTASSMTTGSTYDDDCDTATLPTMRSEGSHTISTLGSDERQSMLQAAAIAACAKNKNKQYLVGSPTEKHNALAEKLSLLPVISHKIKAAENKNDSSTEREQDATDTYHENCKAESASAVCTDTNHPEQQQQHQVTSPVIFKLAKKERYNLFNRMSKKKKEPTPIPKEGPQASVMSHRIICHSVVPKDQSHVDVNVNHAPKKATNTQDCTTGTQSAALTTPPRLEQLQDKSTSKAQPSPTSIAATSNFSSDQSSSLWAPLNDEYSLSRASSGLLILEDTTNSKFRPLTRSERMSGGAVSNTSTSILDQVTDALMGAFTTPSIDENEAKSSKSTTASNSTPKKPICKGKDAKNMTNMDPQPFPPPVPARRYYPQNASTVEDFNPSPNEIEIELIHKNKGCQILMQHDGSIETAVPDDDARLKGKHHHHSRDRKFPLKKLMARGRGFIDTSDNSSNQSQSEDYDDHDQSMIQLMPNEEGELTRFEV
jgi:hypothetical protein